MLQFTGLLVHVVPANTVNYGLKSHGAAGQFIQQLLIPLFSLG